MISWWMVNDPMITKSCSRMIGEWVTSSGWFMFDRSLMHCQALWKQWWQWMRDMFANSRTFNDFSMMMNHQSPTMAIQHICQHNLPRSLPNSQSPIIHIAYQAAYYLLWLVCIPYDCLRFSSFNHYQPPQPVNPPQLAIINQQPTSSFSSRMKHQLQLSHPKHS